MKNVFLLLTVAVASALLVWVLLSGTENAAPESTDSELAGSASSADLPARDRIEALEKQVHGLIAQIEHLRSRPAPEASRAPAVPGARTAGSEEPRADPREYLDRYVASFTNGGNGADYFRLAVDAYAIELLDPIVALLTEPAQPVELRKNLIAMLGTARFRGKWPAIGPLVGLLKREDDAADACVRALAVIGDRDCGRSLESFACWIRSRELRRATMTTAVALADPECDLSVLRLLPCAQDEEEAKQLLASARGNDPAVSLELFRGASALERPVRLAAANRIAEFRTEPLRDLARSWHSTEPDPEVRKRLERSIAKQSEKPRWSPEQVVGPPDADLSRDDVRSWASLAPDLGMEWLELAYPPRRASGVRIFEGLAGGAIAEIHGKLVDGGWVLLWAGRQAEGAPGEWSVNFGTTAQAVSRLKIVLDTSRTTGWNEIDAVELVGPDGSAWVASATASNYYGQ